MLASRVGRWFWSLGELDVILPCTVDACLFKEKGGARFSVLYIYVYILSILSILSIS